MLLACVSSKQPDSNPSILGPGHVTQPDIILPWCDHIVGIDPVPEFIPGKYSTGRNLTGTAVDVRSDSTYKVTTWSCTVENEVIEGNWRQDGSVVFFSQGLGCDLEASSMELILTPDGVIALHSDEFDPGYCDLLTFQSAVESSNATNRPSADH